MYDNEEEELVQLALFMCRMRKRDKNEKVWKVPLQIQKKGG